jgi:hypothetical protein
MRVGRYADAVTANEHAAHADETFIERRHPTGSYPVYYAHNLHFLWAATQMEGRSAESLRAARNLAKTVPPELIRQVPPLETLVPTPLFALVQFGKWADVLQEPQPPEDLRYSRAIWHYARGRALAARNQPDQADDELDSLTTIRVAIKDLSLGFQTAGSLLGVAHAARRDRRSAGDTAMAVRGSRSGAATGCAGLRRAAALVLSRAPNARGDAACGGTGSGGGGGVSRGLEAQSRKRLVAFGWHVRLPGRERQRTLPPWISGSAGLGLARTWC